MASLPPVNASPPVSLSSQSLPAKQATPKSDINPFEKLLIQANQDQLRSDNAIQDLVKGKNDNVQQVVMQVAKSEMSFQLFMEVRNKLIESYNELMRMQF